jgi:hypothetical protein
MDNFNKFSIKNRKKSKWKNNGFRTLFESIIPNEVIMALKDWKDNYKVDNYVLIGGFALSYYLKPRYTEDIDLAFLSYNEIPNYVTKFRRNRKHSFEHIKTGVEIELLTPEHLDRTVDFFENIFESAIVSDGVKISSPEGLIALKLRRFSDIDRSDIIELYKYLRENNKEVELEKYNLSNNEIEKWEKLMLEIDDTINENIYMLTNKVNISNNNWKKYNLGEYEVYIMKEDFGEPRLHIIRNINNRIRRFSDFQFSISLTKPFNESADIRVLDSSTEYNSLSNFPELEKNFKEFLISNLEELRKDWNNLNRRKIKIK